MFSLKVWNDGETPAAECISSAPHETIELGSWDDKRSVVVLLPTVVHLTMRRNVCKE